jgi:heat shock protein HslJ
MPVAVRRFVAPSGPGPNPGTLADSCRRDRRRLSARGQFCHDPGIAEGNVMKAVVGFGFFMLFLAAIALVMLQGRQMAGIGAPGGGAGVTGISWRPVMVGSESIPQNSGMLIRFEVDGSIEGRGGCNEFSGALQQTESGVEVGPLASTRMACPGPIMSRERAFFDALQRTKNLKTTSDGMSLLDENSDTIVEFVADAEK